MDDFLCLTVQSRPAESPADFSSRLSRFWTHMLRTRQSDFEKVYAETTSFEQAGDRLTRNYLVMEEVVHLLEHELTAAAIDFAPVDHNELYSRYEATPPEWMQIEH